MRSKNNLENYLNRVRSSTLIGSQSIGFIIIDEMFFFRVESNLSTELPANRSGEAGHMAISNSSGITNRLLAGLHAIKEIADMQSRICAPDLVLKIATEQFGMA